MLEQLNSFNLLQWIFHGREIIDVIGGDAQLAARSQRTRDRAEKTFVHGPPVEMPPFRPGIGKEEIKNIDRTGPEELPHGMLNFFLDNLCIR